MFYVYGTDGRRFAGTLETILKNQEVEALGGADPGFRNRHAPHRSLDHAGSPPGGGSPQAETEAVTAYRNAINLKKQIGPLLHAYQIMASPVLSVASTASIGSAWRLLRERRIRHLPVLAYSGGAGAALAGIVAENDFYRASLDLGASLKPRHPAVPVDPDVPAEEPVSALMRSPVYSAAPLTELRRIARLMFERHISCMPVVGEGGTLDGIITRSDILRALINHPSFSLWG